nr:MAG TPA: hypothetical protein [Caudoviricetes sp.]
MRVISAPLRRSLLLSTTKRGVLMYTDLSR